MCTCKCFKKLCSLCCVNTEKKEANRANRNIFNEIELPEIVGRINPTYIAKDNVDQENEYRIYSKDSAV